MQLQELKERIKKGKAGGVYLFAGEEDYLKRYYLGELRRTVVADETLAAFNHFTFEGASIDFGAISDAVCTPGMMSDEKLIEWHLADFDGMKEKDLASLETLCEECKSYPECTVVFVATPEGLDAGTDRRPSKLAKRLSAHLSLVLFPLSTDAQLSSWIARHFAAESISITPSLPQSMIERVGHNMSILASEIEKLVFYAKANALSSVGEKEMEFVCVKTVESDAFSLSNALLDGRTEDAYRYLGDMKRRRVEPITVLSQVSRLYGDMLAVAYLSEEGMTPKEVAAELKMHEYKAGLYVKAAKKNGIEAIEYRLKLCAELDTAMKNGVSSYLGLERLIAESATGTSH